MLLAALTAFAIVAASASLSHSRMIDDRVAQMREATELLMGLAQSLQDDVAAGKMTQAEALAQLHQRAHRMTFANGQGYPVVYLPDATTFVNVGQPGTEGKITGARLANGARISDLQFGAAQAAPEGSAFVYEYPRPGQNVPVG
ncbi:MAG TPA: cache domain-containing protein, partial [Chloroflexota bacterium]|nr:cache domain-containing protein [Chloroflexota bacterium]